MREDLTKTHFEMTKTHFEITLHLTKTHFEITLQNGKYVGPLGELSAEDYELPSAFVVMAGGQHVKCIRTMHVSNYQLVCETPEMTSSNVSVVSHVVGQSSQV